MTRYSKSERELIMEVLKPSMGAGAYIKDFRKSDAPQFKGKTEKEKDKMAVAAYLDAKDEMDETKLPPHLAKLFDKDGNFKDKKKQAMFDKMQKAARKGIKYTVKDVTPKGYGPEEGIEEAKKPSMQSLFNLIADTKNAQEGIAKIMKALKVDEKKASAIMDKLIAYALKKETIKEDGHEDVPSSIRMCKNIAEDAGEIEQALASKGDENLDTWWTNKLAVASNSMNKLRDYITTPVQEEQMEETIKLDELKEPFVVIDTADGNKVVGMASDEKGAKSIITTSQLPPMKIKDKKTLKIVKVKKKQMIGQPIKEGFFSKEYEPGQYQNGDEKPFVNAIKKSGGKNIDVQKPTKRDPMLTIEFDGDVKKAQKEVSRVGDGTEELEETKSATGYEIFHKDFSSAMQHATAFAKSKGQPIKKSEIDNKVATGPRKPSKGKENSYTLETEKGKRWSVQVYNMGNKFELNMYLTSSHVPEGDMLDEKLKVSESFFRKITGVDKPILEGRKSSYDTDDDEEGANKHIIMQLRKAQNLRGMFNVEFENGEKKKVPDRVAIAALTKHGRFRTSIEKAAFEKKIRKSYRDLLNALKEK